MFLLEVPPYHPNGHMEEYSLWNSSLSLFLRLNEDGWKTIMPSPTLYTFITAYSTNLNTPQTPEELELFERVLLLLHRMAIGSLSCNLPKPLESSSNTMKKKININPYLLLPHLPPTSSRLIWIMMDILSFYPPPPPPQAPALQPSITPSNSFNSLMYFLSATVNTIDSKTTLPNELRNNFSLFLAEEFSLPLSNILIITLALSKFTNYSQLASGLKSNKSTMSPLPQNLSLLTDLIRSGDFKQELLSFTQEMEKNKASYDLLDDKSSLHQYKDKIIESFQGNVGGNATTKTSNTNSTNGEDGGCDDDDDDDDDDYLDISTYRDSDDLSELDVILLREYLRKEWVFGNGFKARGCKERRLLMERTSLTQEQIEGWAKMLNRNKYKEPLLYDFKRMYGG